MNAEFSKRSARIVHSPYFYQVLPESAGTAAIIAQEEKITEERDFLIEFLDKCEDYKDLYGRAKAIFDLAEEEVKEATKEREDEQVWGPRIFGDESGLSISQEAADLNKLSAGQSQILVLAMLEAQSKGDTDTVKKLADLAKTPQAIEALTGIGPDKEAPPKIQPSPFRNRPR